MSLQSALDLAAKGASRKGRPPIVVAGAVFKTQSELREYVGTLLHKSPVGTSYDKADTAFLLALLARHHEADEKVGVGISKFFTRKHAVYGSVGFAFERVDGSIDDFGIQYCLKTHSAAEVAEHSYRRAARYSVLSSIRSFRDKALRDAPQCAITGEPLRRDFCHVDHAPPNTFSSIAGAFLAYRKMSPIDFAYRCDDLGRCLFVNEYDQADFAIFHDELAVLRILAPSVNLNGGSWGV